MAVSSVVMAVEGVLRKHVTDSPIPVGIALYHGLANTFNVLLCSDLEQKELDRWCSLEGLNRHAAAEANEGLIRNFFPDVRRVQQVLSLRKRGFNIDLVIDPNPETTIQLLAAGFNVLTFTHAMYAMPQWRPDYKHVPKSWENILSHETKMAELRAIEMLQENKED